MRRRVAVIAVLLLASTLWPPAFALRASARQAGLWLQASAPPTRIVSLVPNVTEMLFAIGAGDRVVGVGSFDEYPPEVNRIARVGGLIDPDLERIFALRPGLAIVYASQRELQRQLQRGGIDTYPFRHGGVKDITGVMRDLGTRLGLPAQAERAAQTIENGLAAIRQRTAGRPRPQVLLVIGKEPGTLRGIFASGGTGFLHDILEIAGGQDVFADVNRESVQASTELILSRAPEVVIELHGEALTPEAAAREAKVWSALSSLPAVRRQRVYVLSGQELVIAGPRIVQAAERIARALHPGTY